MQGVNVAVQFLGKLQDTKEQVKVVYSKRLGTCIPPIIYEKEGLLRVISIAYTQEEDLHTVVEVGKESIIFCFPVSTVATNSGVEMPGAFGKEFLEVQRSL